MMNLQTGIPAAAEQAARESAQEPKRYLYIVSRAVNPHSGEIFAAMRRDMSNASVELMYDRRAGERRGHEGPAHVDQERRATDRRRSDAAKEVGAAGWARVRID